MGINTFPKGGSPRTGGLFGRGGKYPDVTLILISVHFMSISSFFTVKDKVIGDGKNIKIRMIKIV